MTDNNNPTVTKTVLTIDQQLSALATIVANLNGRVSDIENKAVYTLARVQAIESDNILDRSEKPKAVVEWQKLNAEYQALNQKRINLGYPTSADRAASMACIARHELEKYLASLSPQWDNSMTDTCIDPIAWKDRWIGAIEANSAYRLALSAIHGPVGPVGTPVTVSRPEPMMSVFPTSTILWTLVGVAVLVAIVAAAPLVIL